MAVRKALDYYLEREYTFEVLADPDGGWVVRFPDLPGALTQVDDLADLPHMVDDVRRLWIGAAYEQGQDIPEPSYATDEQEYSGQFRVRLPKSLHRTLARSAASEGVSLNQLVLMYLSSGAAQRRSTPRPQTRYEPNLVQPLLRAAEQSAPYEAGPGEHKASGPTVS